MHSSRAFHHTPSASDTFGHCVENPEPYVVSGPCTSAATATQGGTKFVKDQTGFSSAVNKTGTSVV